MNPKKKVGIVLAAILVLSMAGCKKTPTVPNADVLTRPVIWVNAFELAFAAFQAGNNPASQMLQVKNAGQNTLKYAIASDADWLTVENNSGDSSGQTNEHSVLVDKSSLTSQEEPYIAHLTITSAEAYNNPQKITVSLSLSTEPPPRIKVSPKNLNFNCPLGTNPPSKTIAVENSGSGTLRFDVVPDANWIQADPSSAQVKDGSRNIEVSAKAKNLSVGTYSGSVKIVDPLATNNPQEVTVTLTITEEPPPEIAPRPDRMTFQVILGSSPGAQTLNVGNSGEGTLSYSLEWDAGWMSINPASGSTKDIERKHTVSVDSASMGIGTYHGTILIRDPNATNNPSSVPVTLDITAPLTDNRIGIFLNPSSGGTNTTVSIPITIRGNTSPIEVFGLKMNYNPAVFQYVGVTKGDLTGSWMAVDGNAASGVVTIGGFAGSGTTISTGNLGSIAVITFRVTCSACSDGQTSQISIHTLTDDVSGMTASPASASFTFRK